MERGHRRCLPRAWSFGGDILQLAKAVPGDGSGGSPRVPGAETGERSSEEAVGGSSVGDRRDEGGDAKKAVKPRQRRTYVMEMKEQSVSEKRSCKLMGICRSSYHYQPVEHGDADLITRLREIAEDKPTGGYRTAWAFLRREGLVINHKRVHRVRKEAGSTQPAKAETEAIQGRLGTGCGST